jgi:hypothetical protein
MNHNLNDPRHPWMRLTAAARRVRDDRDTAMPYGFATRIAALALALEQKIVSLFDRFALRALSISCALAILSVAVNYQDVSAPSTASATIAMGSVDEVMLPTSDTVTVIFDLAD